MLYGLIFIMFVNTFFGPQMITYSLTFSDNGVCVDGELYANLDDARDVAFEYSAETNRQVAINEEWGASSHLVETVLA
jgi:hypothetical protein